MNNKGFTTIPPKQRYMTLVEIHDVYGSRGVVAYSCKTVDNVPEGGFVIAIQDKSSNSSRLKEYQQQLKQKYPAKAPIYYLRVDKVESSGCFTFTYDNGTGERKLKTAPKIEEAKKTEAEIALERIPDEFLAKALATAIRIPNDE